MKKKLIAMSMATVMSVSSVLTLGAQTLTGHDTTEWWAGTAGYEYVLAGDGEIEFDVKCTSLNSAGFAHYTVEIRGDGSKTVDEETTTGYGCIDFNPMDAWFFAGGCVTADITTEVAGDNTPKVNEVYTVNVTKSGKTVTVTTTDSTDKVVSKHVAANTSFTTPIRVAVVAHSGTFVIEKEPEILKGTGWWDEGKEVGQNFELVGQNAVAEWYIESLEASGSDNITVIEFNDTSVEAGYDIRIDDKTAWKYGAVNTVDPVVTAGTGSFVVGSKLRVRLERVKEDLTVKIYNADGSVYMTTTFTDTQMTGDTILIRNIAQLGTFKITRITTDSIQDATTTEPKVYAQYKAETDGEYTVRFVAEVAMDETYQQLGFRCDDASASGDNYWGSKVYKSIMSDGEKVEAADGNCFVVFELTDVDADAKFYVTPVAQVNNSAEYIGSEIAVDMSAIVK